MYNVLMNYFFKKDQVDAAFDIWKNAVAKKLNEQPGFIRAQFYKFPDGRAVAIGSWEKKENADNFMKTGVFKDLLSDFEKMMVKLPEHNEVDMLYFEEK
jgi:pentatricopeptide repeat protein